MIYVASPYSHEDPAVMQARMENVYAVIAELINDEEYAFSPLLMRSGVKRYELPADLEFFLFRIPETCYTDGRTVSGRLERITRSAC